MTSSICFSKLFIQWPLPYASVSSRGKEVREKGQRIMIPLLSFLALPILIYTVKAYKQFTCFKIRYSFRSIKQFGNVTKFLLGQPLGHVKGAPRKDRGHEDRLDSIFPRQNHLFYGVEMTALTQVLYCFITFFDELYLSEGFRKGKKVTLNFAISKA